MERMNLEEQNQMCSNSSNGVVGGGSKSSKKQKQKKIPQRGLGVAQLEKIRIEEQKKKDAANTIFTSPPIVSPTNSSSLPAPLLNYPSSKSSSSVPFPSPSPTSISASQNPILKLPLPIPNIDSFYLNSVPPLNHPNGRGGSDVEWPSIPTFHGRAHLHKMWYPYELNHDGENSRWDHGLPLPPNMSLPFQSSPIIPLSYTIPSAPQFSQASASSMMNIPLINSSSVLSFRMEPPSNQSLCSNLSSLWPEEEKMYYAKRPYPFPVDTPPFPSFQGKLPRIASRSDESSLFGNGSLFNSDHAIPILQETPSLPSSSTTEPILKKSNKENGSQNGDFLSLGPPSVTSPHPSPRLRHSFPYGTAEDSVAISPRSAGLNHRISENLVVNSGHGSASLNHKQPFFSFPLALKAQQETSTTNSHINSNGNVEVGGVVDLNLKL